MLLLCVFACLFSILELILCAWIDCNFSLPPENNSLLYSLDKKKPLGIGLAELKFKSTQMIFLCQGHPYFEATSLVTKAISTFSTKKKSHANWVQPIR